VDNATGDVLTLLFMAYLPINDPSYPVTFLGIFMARLCVNNALWALTKFDWNPYPTKYLGPTSEIIYPASGTIFFLLPRKFDNSKLQ
jgi:hypothetical protein